MANDVSATIVVRSDQLNSEDLLPGGERGGPMVITVTRVRVTNGEQPVSIEFEGDRGKPYKPSKTQRKVLSHAWGNDADAWIGRSMQLWCDPEITYGKEKVGGVRISHMSDIPGDFTVSLLMTKGKKSPHSIRLLKMAPKPAAEAEPPISDEAVHAAVVLLEAAASGGPAAFTAAWTPLADPLKRRIGRPERDRIAKLASAAASSTPATTEGNP